MIDFDIKYTNDVHLRVNCSSDALAMELSEFFTFEVPNARFIPSVKIKMWDGKIRLFNLRNNSLYVGLLSNFIKFCTDRSYTYQIDPKLLENSKETCTSEEAQNFLESLNIHSNGQKLVPMTHQIEAIRHFIERSRCLLLSPTGSGKSLVIYAIIRLLESSRVPDLNFKKKTLIVVPTVSLVHQLTHDFKDYSSENKWDSESKCHQIFSGEEKNPEKPVVISTWQSIHRMSKEYFSQFDSVIWDECHLADSTHTRNILEKLETCPVRVGTTGTLNGMKTSRLVLEGLFGPVHRVAYSKDLMDQNILSELAIKCLVLKYSQEERSLVKNLKYHEEIEFLLFHEKRCDFLVNLALSTKGNTMLLFQYVEKHGKILYEKLKLANKDSSRKIFYISGETEAQYREQVRKLIESQDNAIIVGSVGVLSTGINIKKLHNIIFGSPSKARVRVLQSIGRQLRKHKDKSIATLYDVSDDLQYKSKQNYSLKHLMERIKIYNEEKFDYKIYQIKLT